MPVGLKAPQNLLPINGIRLASCASGIKKTGAADTVLIDICEGATTAAVFTQNAFCAAPVIVSKAHIAAASPRALIINSGNANAGTGEPGMQAAMQSCDSVAAAISCNTNQVLPFSTGVIGELLPVEKIQNSLTSLTTQLDETNWQRAAAGIMTTDTIAKAISKQVELDGKAVTITGIAKGSGMIRPDMATMLAYIATDAQINAVSLQECLNQVVDKSFNAITVDGDTSTNDACVLIATGKSGVTLDRNNIDFMQALQQVFTWLAQAIIRDGEGATKFVSVDVTGAKDKQESRKVAYTIAHSPLVKTALFASDPNWGRILAAVGRADIHDIDIHKITIHLDDVCIVENGARSSSYTEQQGQAVMDKEEFSIKVSLGRGSAAMTIWTSDLSHEYVKINAEYRT